jgi:hypothetical protein
MLTDVALKAMNTPGRTRDAKVTGLYVQVTLGRDGEPKRSFNYRYSVNGRSREMGLGPYPVVSLSEAREKAQKAAAQCKEGLDPLGEAQKAKVICPCQRPDV